MSIDGLVLQELREIVESIAEQSDGDWLGADDARLILALMDERDAALDAEGVGLPWVSVGERLPDESQGDLLVYNTKWVDSVAAEDVDENCRGWYWLPLSTIPLPGQSPEPSAALRAIEAQENILKDCAYRVRYAGECLRELDRECEALLAENERLRELLKEADIARRALLEREGLREAREMMHRVRLGMGRLLRDRMPADVSDMRAWAEDLDRGIDAALRADEKGGV